ncbi:MAG TPA: TetR/AcrR family transcriptional regulator [Pararhizobium sp.]|uniref:TetR/AcrR family transcriptional regulator n=1 Tax=Pararhizobium sp. TaxID=1977563 RepID=UPI002CEE80C3|nr:TetR/AcrR family transcriptional regulator [Pararhizobium sp.]HTO31115.1 TetR/AcrR family transcriptional regulator [Pararhizobium sp.]
MPASENNAPENSVQGCERADDRWPVGRKVAGEDPAKREQIIEGAKRVFMSVGFDAASMNDITREAGVSKGTIYVYFENKEDLFSAMIERERAIFLATVRTVLASNDDVETGLYKFGVSFVTHMTGEKVINAMRTVLGVRDRMPDLCRRFFKGPENLRTVLQEFLKHQVDLGNLRVDDLDLAAGQFLDLSSGGFFKVRLFGTMEHAPPPQEIDRVITGAVRVFLAAYGVKASANA